MNNATQPMTVKNIQDQVMAWIVAGADRIDPHRCRNCGGELSPVERLEAADVDAGLSMRMLARGELLQCVSCGRRYTTFDFRTLVLEDAQE